MVQINFKSNKAIAFFFASKAKLAKPVILNKNVIANKAESEDTLTASSDEFTAASNF